MSISKTMHAQSLEQRLAEAEATIEALLSGQIDAVVDSLSQTPVLLSKAQDALRDSEERYRRIVETASEGIWTIDTEAKISFANGRIAEMLGYQVGEMVGRSLFEFLPTSSRDSAADRITRGATSGTEEADGCLKRRDGSELYVGLKITSIHHADGTYAGSLAMITDRTRHREDEERLRKSEEQYRQIVETTSDGVVRSDGDGRILFVNRRFAAMLGYLPLDMIGVSIFNFMGSAAKELATEAYQRRRHGAEDVVDSTFCHRDGTEIWVSIAGSPMLDGAGQYIGNMGVVRDITQQRKLQAQLMVSDRMASVGTLAAGVAHEINNPLAAVLGNLECIADSMGRATGRDPAWLIEEIKSPLDDAREAAQRVRFIVRDLKIFSSSPGEEQHAAVDVKATMESSLRMAWNEVRHRAQLVKHYGFLPPVRVNEARLGQVFLNLVVNAAQALPEGRAEHNQITVTTRLAGAQVIIEVSDTGPGIPPEIIGRIFDAFFTTKAVGVGTGLGLAICHRIITDMAGTLTVESQLGKGTTFRVTLPAAGNDPPEAVIPVAQVPVVAAARRGRILVVDDEALLVRGVQRMLAKEHDVSGTTSAKDALARCVGGERFDLILCDLMMPDMTGMDLHRELSRIAPEQANRMIFLTGGAFTTAARQFLETPMEHLEKPFDPANLRAIVQRYLRLSD